MLGSSPALAFRGVAVVSVLLASVACSGGGGGSSDPGVTPGSAARATIVFPPVSSATVEGDRTVVRGSASVDEGAVVGVTVNGVAATSTDGFQSWVASVPLDVGTNTLSVNTETDSGIVAPDVAMTTVVRSGGNQFLGEPPFPTGAGAGAGLVLDDATGAGWILSNDMQKRHQVLSRVDFATGNVESVWYKASVTGVAATYTYIPSLNPGFAVFNNVFYGIEVTNVFGRNLLTLDLTTLEERRVPWTAAVQTPPATVIGLPVLAMVVLPEENRAILLVNTSILVSVDLTTGEGLQLPTPPSLSYFGSPGPTLALDRPSQQLFLYSTGFGSLYRVDLQTGTSLPISPPTPSFSGAVPHGVAFDRRTGQLLLLDFSPFTWRIRSVDPISGVSTPLLDLSGPIGAPIGALAGGANAAYFFDGRTIFEIDALAPSPVRPVVEFGNPLPRTPTASTLMQDGDTFTFWSRVTADSTQWFRRTASTGRVEAFGSPNVSPFAGPPLEGLALASNSGDDVLVKEYNSLSLWDGSSFNSVPVSVNGGAFGSGPSMGPSPVIAADPEGLRAWTAGPSGGVLQVDLVTGTRVPIPGLVDALRGAAFDAVRGEVVLLTAEAVLAYDPDSGIVTTILVRSTCVVADRPCQLFSSLSLSLADPNLIYIADRNENRIIEFDRVSGQSRVVALGLGAGRLSAVDSNGTLYVAGPFADEQGLVALDVASGVWCVVDPTPSVP